jgi:uncharacterized protein (DUF1697 family)
MKKYIVLLRGINVGGENLISMKELVRYLEEGGFHNVKTYIQSGNIVLESKSLVSTDLGVLIEAKFGFKPGVVILEKSEFDRVIRNNPFNPKDGKFAHFYFCSEHPKLHSENLDKYRAESEEYEIMGNVFYLYAPNGIGRSKLVANIESCLGVSATGRNLNTISKLSEMVKNT